MNVSQWTVNYSLHIKPTGSKFLLPLKDPQQNPIALYIESLQNHHLRLSEGGQLLNTGANLSVSQRKQIKDYQSQFQVLNSETTFYTIIETDEEYLQKKQQFIQFIMEVLLLTKPLNAKLPAKKKA